jgi:hypothetical protein
MKKLVQLVLASVVGASMFVGVAAADTCTITNTGQASVNTCTSSESQVLTVTCNNDLNNILFVNGQSANTGTANLTSNGQGGFAYSGDAGNFNSVDLQADLSCGPAVAAVTPTPTPVTPTPVAATPAATPAPAAAKVVSLPKTGSSAVLNSVAVVAAVVSGGLLAAQLGTIAYRRLALK